MPRGPASLSGYRAGRGKGLGAAPFSPHPSCFVVVKQGICSQCHSLDGWLPYRYRILRREHGRNLFKCSVSLSAILSPYFFFFFNNVVLDLFYICNGNGIPSILKSYAVLPSGCWKRSGAGWGARMSLLPLHPRRFSGRAVPGFGSLLLQAYFQHSSVRGSKELGREAEPQAHPIPGQPPR